MVMIKGVTAELSQRNNVAAQIHSKIRLSSSGRKSGGTCDSRGALYYLSNNRIYIGQIVDRVEAYPGQHEPIIKEQL